MDYIKQAKDFMEKHEVTMTTKFLRHGKYFPEDKDTRDIYEITLTRGEESYTFTFGQSIVDSAPPKKKWEQGHAKKRIPPTEYSVLACLTTYPPELDVWSFANEFGYVINSRETLHKVEGICLSVNDEYRNVMRLFGDVIEELAEIA